MLLIAEGSCDFRRVEAAYAFFDPTSGVDVQDSCWKMFIYLPWVAPSMSFKKTSDTIAVSFGLTESAPNTFTQEEIALQLDVLNNEIFVVLAIDLNPSAPDAIAATDTTVSAQLTSTSQTDTVFLSNSNCLAISERQIRAAGFVDGGVAFTHFSGETPTGDVDYIGLIATNNFFVGIEGSNNAAAKGVSGRLWGYRARADASTYAALVQSEVLSS